MVTLLPDGRTVPAAGAWLRTVPAGCELDSLTTDVEYPEVSSALLAEELLMPTTLGTFLEFCALWSVQ